MVTYSWRFLKRFFVLIPGLIIAYFSVRDIFPYFDRRLPLGVAVFVTYVLGAYLLIPALIRLVRLVRPARHLPLYCVTPDGFASDPLNIGVVGTMDELVAAMQQSGWFVADPSTWHHKIKQIVSVLLGHIYQTAPVSTLYLLGRRHDIAFEIPVEGNGVGKRHHVRFWAMAYQEGTAISIRHIRRSNRRSSITHGRFLWIGAASLDTGIAPIRHNLQITHMVDPDTDRERELIVRQLRHTNRIDSIESIQLGRPYQLVNRAFRGYLKTDGRMQVVHLKPQSIL